MRYASIGLVAAGAAAGAVSLWPDPSAGALRSCCGALAGLVLAAAGLVLGTAHRRPSGPWTEWRDD